MSFKKVIYFLIIVSLGTYLYLAVPYLVQLTRYYSLSGSGMKYALNNGGDLDPKILTVKPVSERFGLVITKLGLNKKVQKEVDYFDQEKLVTSLKIGLAHLKNSGLPGGFGTMVIIGHPLDTLFNFPHTNPDFYLINKLTEGDQVTVFYNGAELTYRVVSCRIEDEDYLDFFDPGSQKKLLLVSGYPPGLAYKLLVVEALQLDN